MLLGILVGCVVVKEREKESEWGKFVELVGDESRGCVLLLLLLLFAQEDGCMYSDRRRFGFNALHITSTGVSHFEPYKSPPGLFSLCTEAEKGFPDDITWRWKARGRSPYQDRNKI